jgi:Calcineurin-like phosphoesterase
VVRVLAVSDVVDEALAADVSPVRGAEVIVACGDLPFGYLGQLMNALDVPLVFVPGNHDPDVSGYRMSRGGLWLRSSLPDRPPWPDGAVNADGRVVDVAGLRIAGLGGSPRYRPGPNQYTGRQQAWRARRLATRAWLRGAPAGAAARPGRPRVDLLLTHAPPRGVGDGSDPPHQGFPALHRLARRLRPPLLLHGHVDPGPAARAHWLDRTLVLNVTGHMLLDAGPGTSVTGAATAGQPAGSGRPGAGKPDAG